MQRKLVDSKTDKNPLTVAPNPKMIDQAQWLLRRVGSFSKRLGIQPSVLLAYAIFNTTTLAAEDVSVQGTIVDNRGIPLPPSKEIKIYSSSNKELVHTIAKANSEGEFNVNLAPGRYLAHVGESRSRATPEISFHVSSNAVKNLRIPFGLRGSGKGVRRVIGAGEKRELFHNFEIKYGLPSLEIPASVKDHNGILWFSSVAGLMRFDGIYLTTFTTNDGLAWNGTGELAVDSKNNLWIGYNVIGNPTADGLTRFDGTEFVTWTRDDGLPPAMVWSLELGRHDTIWGGTYGGGLFRFDGVTSTRIRFENEILDHTNVVYTILEDRNGELWVGTRIGLYRGRSEGQPVLQKESTLPANSIIRSLLESEDGTIWIGTDQDVYLARDQRIFRHQELATKYTGRIHSIYEDVPGSLWFGTGTSGAYHLQEGVISHVFPGNGLISATIYSMTHDTVGNMWFGTTGGISRLNRQISHYTSEDGLPSNGVMDLYRDRRGTLWIGTFKGVARHKDGEFSPVPQLDGLNLRHILEARDGTFWFSTAYQSAGLFRFDGSGWMHFVEGTRGDAPEGTPTPGLLSNFCYTAFQDVDGILWFGNGLGASRYDGTNMTSFEVLNNDTKEVKAILQDHSGSYWFATQDKGIFRWDGQDQWSHMVGGKDFPAAAVYKILQTRDQKLWFGTDNGLLLYNGKRFDRFGVQDGLEHNKVTGLYEDSSNILWIGTFGGGLTRYDGTIFRPLTKSDGLPNNIVHDFQEEPGGKTWIATEGGLCLYRSSKDQPRIHVTNVITDKSFGEVGSVTLSSNPRLLEFEFVGGSMSSLPNEVVYRYRLKGWDEEWTVTRQTQVRYQNLARGEYTFEVEVIDKDLKRAKTQILVTITPPYLIIAIIVLSTLIILGGTVGVYVVINTLRIRNRLLEQSNRQKSEFVANVSHELRTPLTAIKGFVDNMIEGITGDLNDKQQHYLSRMKLNSDRLSRMINDLLDLSRIEAGTFHLHRRKVDPEPIVGDVIEALRTIALEKEIQLGFQGSSEGALVEADSDRLFQIISNLVSNAIKFTGARGSVTVQMNRSVDAIRITVIDNGIGIAPELREEIFDRFRQVNQPGTRARGVGIGLSIVKALVELHQGTIAIKSEPGKGSEFCVTLPAAD